MSNLLALEAVARRRSFTMAAAELNLTASAVSHQVARLESLLGVRLFYRSAHGVELSAEGKAYLARVGGAISAITSATEDLRERGSNSLYVHSSPSLASLWLLPRLHSFSQQHPQIALSLSATHTPADFALSEADVDIRYGVPTWRDVAITPLFNEKVTPLATPAMIESLGLRNIDDVLRAPLIHSRVSVVQWSDWVLAFSDRISPKRFSLAFDRAQMALDAASQGLGIALESTTIASSHLAQGRLARVFGGEMETSIQAHYCVYPLGQSRKPELDLFIDWLLQEARTTAA